MTETEVIVLTKENSNTYGKVRKSILENWLTKSKRKRATNSFEDDFSESLVCEWQNKWQDGHVSVFCSIGEWSSNISDILSDEKYDYLYYITDSEVLFRLYTRFLMVISELIEDLQHINSIIKDIDPDDKKKSGRDFEQDFFYL